MTDNKLISGSDWTDLEVEAIVSDYFLMLNDELKGLPVNKSQHRKQLLSLLNGRSEGSIEFKHQNISAALIKWASHISRDINLAIISSVQSL